MTLEGLSRIEPAPPPVSIDDVVAILTSEFDTDEWERDGHIPPKLFAVLGSRGFFEHRWSLGAEGGIPFAMEAGRVFGRHNLAAGLTVSLHSEVFLHALHRFPGSPMTTSVRHAALAGEAIGCMALTEDTGGSDVAAVRCAARRTADGDWRLTGAKRFISNAGTATHALVLAQADTGRRMLPTLFLVDLRAAGIEVGGFYPKVGTRAADAARIRLDTIVPAGAVLGPVGGGLACVAQLLRYERLSVGAGVLEAARSALELAVAFLRWREQAGDRMFSRQALRHRAAACDVQLRAADALLRETAADVMSGTVTEAKVAATKFFAAKVANEVADEALQFLGGRGYTEVFPVERIWRDVRLARIGAGTDEIMLEIVGAALDRSGDKANGVLERCFAVDHSI